MDPIPALIHMNRGKPHSRTGLPISMQKSEGSFLSMFLRFFESAKDLTVENDWVYFANMSYKPTLLHCAP